MVGCTEKLVTATPPDVPVFLPKNVAQPVTTQLGDTSDISIVHNVPINFLWQTDRATTDTFYSGTSTLALNDSVVANNVFDSGLYSHYVEAKRFPVATKIYFRVRALGSNGNSTFSPVGSYSTPN